MQGRHGFDLDCMYLTRSSRTMGMSIVVDYEVEIGWDKGSQYVTHGKTTPVTVTIEVGGNEMLPELFAEMVGPLKAFIIEQSKTLDLFQLGITDEEAREELAGIQEQRDNAAAHQAGRV